MQQEAAGRSVQRSSTVHKFNHNSQGNAMMDQDQHFDNRGVDLQDSSLSGFHLSAGQQTKNEASVLDDKQLIAHMQKTMRRNLEVQCYSNAIFFADKVVNLLS